MTITLLFNRNWHNTVNQLYFNKKNLGGVKKKKKRRAYNCIPCVSHGIEFS